MNRLHCENSLYLRQHANNPVDWRPWGPEALAVARAEDKPLLVSIGYSACHWCHVMAHESFENDYIAGLMNRHFICVKIDREERPDLDKIYMEAMQMMSGQGGWPLNMFCLPDGRPFAGGTYFPPEDRGQGLVPWPLLLMRVADFYRRDRASLEDNAAAVEANMKSFNHPWRNAPNALSLDSILHIGRQFAEDFDELHGGFGGAPKFPPAMTLDFLAALSQHRASGQADRFSTAGGESLLNQTMAAMIRGGLYDQVGGGFYRYCVDRQWTIPHFEKMLYDNALLLDICVKGWRLSLDPLCREAVRETAVWLHREMALPGGGWAASLDADSGGHEGRYYVWRPEEIHTLLGVSEGRRFCSAYGVTDDGNFEERTTHLTLRTASPEIRLDLRAARERLLEARRQRVRPTRDDKLIPAWNALVIRSLALASRWLDEPVWWHWAEQAAEKIWRCGGLESGPMAALIYGDQPIGHGNLDDHALYALACLTLAGTAPTGCSAVWLERSRSLARTILERFGDADRQPGFFFTAADQDSTLPRKKEWFDNAMPSGQAAMVHLLVALQAIDVEADWRNTLDNMRLGWGGIAASYPQAAPFAWAGFMHEANGIVVIQAGPGADLEDLWQAIRRQLKWRPIMVMTNDELPPRVYQPCVGSVCLQPSVDPAEAVANL